MEYGANTRSSSPSVVAAAAAARRGGAVEGGCGGEEKKKAGACCCAPAEVGVAAAGCGVGSDAAEGDAARRCCESE
jgi:hypothetical protein